MRHLRWASPAAAAAALLLLSGGAAHAGTASFAGAWDLKVEFADGNTVSAMTLTQADGKIAGTSGPLDENRFFAPLAVAGDARDGVADLEFSLGARPIGRLHLRQAGDEFAGTGEIYGVAVKVTVSRPVLATAKPVTHIFQPSAYHTHFSSQYDPVLRINPGDTVKTSTLDNEGQDAALKWRGMPGNTLTGPFYVVGAMPGDTLVVRLDRVALNRDTAKMYSGKLDARAIQGAEAQTPTPGWGRTWTVDHAKGAARLAEPGPRLVGLEIPVRPMVGSIGVAPPGNQSLFAGDLGPHGGNLDNNRLVTGATLYIPVFQAGALLSLGDGHALQGDGEISGQGLETSLDVDFTVELIKGQSLGQVWAEDDTYVMVSGIDNSLDGALRQATSGLSRWLKQRYALTDSEIAALLSSSIQYQVAEVVDPRPHMVAKIAKRTLAMLKPASGAPAP